MFKRITILVAILALMTCFIGSSNAQLLWQDNFNDTATDPFGLVNVGWLRFDATVGLVGSSVAQVDSELVVTSGNFAGIASIGIIQSNGMPFVDPTDTTATKAAILTDPPIGSPNVTITFQVNFVNVTNPLSYFALIARQDITDSTETFPNPDVREDTPGYPLFISPAGGVVRLGKYGGAPLQGLAPESWTYFGESAFTFTPDTYYWCKYSLDEGNIFVKFWEGERENEPRSWLIAGTDPSPRVTGTYLTIAYAGSVADSGTVFKLDNITVEGNAVGTSVDEPGLLTAPTEFSLHQNYPNPFNPSTTIQYDLLEESEVTLKIYDGLGKEISVLVQEKQSAGNKSVVWNGLNQRGQRVPSGVYIYKLHAGDQTLTKKMLLLQ